MDRIYEAYNGSMGAEFMHKTRERLHWICSQVWGSRVLDVGCSQGVVPLILARMGYFVDGIDINSEAIAFANEQLAKESADVQAKVTYTAGDFGRFALPKESKYDVITMSEVLEHLVRPQDFVRKAFSILPENGRFIVTVPFGINDDPDHRQTFYLTSIYSLIHPLFEIGGVKIFNGWIGLVGRRRAEETKEPPVIPLNLIRQAEEAFFRIERPLRDGTLAVRNQRQELKDKQEKLAEDLRAAEQARLEAEAKVAAADATPLRSELADVRGQLSASEGEVQSLQTSLEVERKASAGLQDQVSMLKAMLQFATSRQQDSTQETRLLEYSQEVRDLRNALDQKRDEAIRRAEEFGRLSGRVEHLELSNKQLAAECESEKRNVAVLESAVAAARKTAASEQAQRQKLSEDVSEAGSRLATQTARIEELEAELARRRTWTEQHKRESKDVRMQLFSVQNELAEKTRALTDAESRYEAESKAHQESLAKIDELGEQTDDQALRITELTAERDRAMSERDSVLVEREDERKKLAVLRSETDARIAELVAACEASDKQAVRIKALETELAEQEKKLQGNGAALAKSEAACISERKAKQESEAKVADLVKQVEALKKESSGHLAELAKLRAENMTLTARCDSAEKARKEISNQANSSAQTIRRLNGDLAYMKAKLSKTEKRLDVLSKAKLCRLTLKYWKFKDALKRRAGKDTNKNGRDIPEQYHIKSEHTPRSVSVIIPTYKENPYLEEAVRSVLNQNYPVDKLVALVCVNGPDKKYYKSLCKKYAHDKRIRVLYTKTPGANAGRNIGIQACDTDLLTFLDDDDYLTPGFISALSGGFDTEDVNVAAGRLINFDPVKKLYNTNTYFVNILRQIGGGLTSDFSRAASLFASFCEKMYRTEFFKTTFGVLAEHYKHSEDVLFWAEHFGDLKGSLYIADPESEEAYVRRITEGSLSRPKPEMEYRFYVTDRLEILSFMAKLIFDESKSKSHKAVLLGRIKTQTAIMRKYYESLTGEDRERARDEINRSDCLFLNKSLFANRVAIAFCHNFSPYVDASAFVATKRIPQIDEMEGEPLQWHVVMQNMSKIRSADRDFQNYYAQFRCVDQTPMQCSIGFAPAGQEPYAKAALEHVKDIEAEVIYSRALFVGSHMAASRYKKLHPKTKWYAEFSDPHAYGVDNKPRPCTGTPTWFDIEQLVYEGADVIIFTNKNQMEYMLSYNPKPEMNESIRRRAVVKHHPVLPHEFCGLLHSDYQLDATKINIGFFGTFYVTRKCDDLLLLLENKQVVLHIFTTKPEDLKDLVAKYGSQIRVNNTISQFEFLNLGSRLDYLVLTDTEFPGKINPFLPSKYADYLVTGTPIIAKVQRGSVLAEENAPCLIKISEVMRDFAIKLGKRRSN